ncbi:MAG: IS1634 family transposase [Proteobacteria bacterium]|nr:IS1634 family transposase [Pseudomonadota bacterium]
MYIKKVTKQNKGSNKQYEYLHLVENVRTDRGPRQRLILNLGTLNIPEEQYKELANCIEGQIAGQRPLFSPDPAIERQAKKAVKRILEKRSQDEAFERSQDTGKTSPVFQNVDVASIEANEPRTIGPEYVCHSVWKELQMDEALLSSGVSPHSLPLIEALVVGRLVVPDSELHTWAWAENRSAIFELTGKPLRYSLNSFYRAADIVLKCKDALEAHLSKLEKELFVLPESMCFLDLTNTYLEGQAFSNPKAKRARSKEKRSDCKLLTLALIIDEQGFAKYSHLYAGNQNEGKTLPEMIQSLIGIRPDLAQHRTVIVDAGIATEENVQYLKDNKFHYIVVNRGKANFTPDDTGQMQVVHQDDNRQFKLEATRREKEGEAFLLCRSTGREQKDRSIRTRQEDLFIERLEYYKSGLGKKGHTRDYTKLIEMIGRLRERYPRASKCYDVTVIPDKDVLEKKKKAKAMDIIWEKRHADHFKFDGCYVLRTNLTDMTDQEIWKTYMMLTRVEKAFRCLKSSLGLRPVFHQIEYRSDAHMFISVLAYHILHVIEQKLRSHGDNRSWDTIRDILSTHQRLTIEYDIKEQDTEKTIRYHLNLCSKPEPEQKMIYHRLKLSGMPLGKKYVAVK